MLRCVNNKIAFNSTITELITCKSLNSLYNLKPPLNREFLALKHKLLADYGEMQIEFKYIKI